jgi:hypothetical protein
MIFFAFSDTYIMGLTPHPGIDPVNPPVTSLN